MKRTAKPKHKCHPCPFRAPSGRCLDRRLKSGRCGDWIWYMRGGKQCRRSYARPKDPRTLAQMHSRGRLSAASSLYSQALADEQRDACITAGAKVQSRRRLDQSGPLTGQQYWVHKEAARRKAQSKATKLKTAPQISQPQRVTRSTSGTHRGISRVPPRPPPAGDRVCAEGRRENQVCRTQDGPGHAAITSIATSESYAFHAETLPEYYRNQIAAGSSAVPESHCTSGSCVAHATGDTEPRCQTPPAIEGSWRS